MNKLDLMLCKNYSEDVVEEHCRIQQYQICGIGMLELSHEFIKILDKKMDNTLDNMLYVKKEILVKEEKYRSGMQP